MSHQFYNWWTEQLCILKYGSSTNHWSGVAWRCSECIVQSKTRCKQFWVLIVKWLFLSQQHSSIPQTSPIMDSSEGILISMLVSEVLTTNSHLQWHSSVAEQLSPPLLFKLCDLTSPVSTWFFSNPGFNVEVTSLSDFLISWFFSKQCYVSLWISRSIWIVDAVLVF